jgi:hypothetical protein
MDDMWRHFRPLELVASEPVVDAARQLALSVSDIAGRAERTISQPTGETLQQSADAEAAAADAFERFKKLVCDEIVVAVPARNLSAR